MNDEYIFAVLSNELKDGNTVNIASPFCRAIDEVKEKDSQDNVNTL